jgi:serine/threonine-protein kinase ATR
LSLNHDRDGNICEVKCSVCDVPNLDVLTTYDETVATEAVATFNALIAVSEFEESSKPRVLGMLALRAFVMHFKDSEFLNLETSNLGQWCLRSLRSSIRELRVAAGYDHFNIISSLLSDFGNIGAHYHFFCAMALKTRCCARIKLIH